MTTFKIVELPRKPSQAIVPHQVEIDGTVVFHGSYHEVGRFVWNRCFINDIIIEEYPIGKSVSMSCAKFMDEWQSV